MRNADKTKEQLISELGLLRQRIAELEALETERQRAEETIRRKLEFEETVARISSRFINFSNIDSVINALLVDIGTFSEASRAYIFLFHKDGTMVSNTHEWCTDGVSPQIANLQNLPCEMFPWWMTRLRKGEVIHIKDISKMPGEANAEKEIKEILEDQDIKSLLVLPLNIGGKLAGFLGFTNVVKAKQWSNDDLALLHVSSEIIANALCHKRMEEKEKEYVRDLAFLSETAIGFVELSTEQDIYQFIGERLKELAGDCLTLVSSFNRASDSFYIRTVLGVGEHMERILKILGQHPVGMSTPINDEAKLALTSGKLVYIPGGLYQLSIGKIPKTACHAIEKLLGLGDAYDMGFAWGGELFGSAIIFMHRGAELRNQSIIETFISEASVALQRRQAEEALRKAHDNLEIRVKERTVELARANETLQIEVTKRKIMEESIKELYEAEKKGRQELEKEAKARGQFINVLAHELRTPLTPILASTEMLKDALSSRPQSVEFRLASNTLIGAQELTSRLEELLDLARFSSGTFTIKLQPLNAEAILKEMVSQFQPVAENKGQRLILDLPQTLPVIEADRSKLEQVLMNLLSNASKFSPEGGNITLRARAEGNDLVIEVQDQGIGISPEEQERLFEPYHRVEQDRQRFPGLGLGLAVSKQIIEAHEGTIWLTTQLGQGSTFSFSLPLERSRGV